jgi:hypothetical protein
MLVEWVVMLAAGAIVRARLWRDGRVAEGARLESVYTGNRIVGSNPTPSATVASYPDFIVCSEGYQGSTLELLTAF